MSGSLVSSLMLSREDWLEYLESTFKIRVVRDGDLVSLKYNQIESPMHDPIVQECRGMVVDVARRRVLAWPYNKFWNHGEALAAPIDWASASVLEKLDGSLIILHYVDVHRGWCVATSGHPTAGGSFGEESRTFRDAFWQLVDTGLLWVRAADTRLTYMFELCDAPNRIVVRHDKPRLVLHGARDTETGRELTLAELNDAAGHLHCEVVKTYPIASIDDCLAASEALDPLASEGFVVVDAAFNRVKIKSPRYVALHHMKGEATPRRAIELWQTGETEELLAHFPEMASTIGPVQDRLEAAALRALADFITHRRAPTRKDFALAVKDAPWSAATFRLYQHPDPSPATARAVLRGLTLAALERIAA